MRALGCSWDPSPLHAGPRQAFDGVRGNGVGEDVAAVGAGEEEELRGRGGRGRGGRGAGARGARRWRRRGPDDPPYTREAAGARGGGPPGGYSPRPPPGPQLHDPTTNKTDAQ